MFYPGGGAVVSLPCTNLGSAAKRLKKSDLVVTQPYNLFAISFWFFKYENNKKCWLVRHFGPITSFLSSLCFSEDTSSVIGPNHTLSFRLLNEDFEMSFDEFCERLGFTKSRKLVVT